MLTPLSSVSDFRTAFPALSDIEIHGIKNIFSQFNANKDGKVLFQFDFHNNSKKIWNEVENW